MRLVESAGVLIRCQDRFLLCHSTFQSKLYGWGLPKGRVDSGESPIQAAARELYEESGYKVRENELSLLTTLSYRTSDDGEKVRKKLYVYLHNAPDEAIDFVFHCDSMFVPHWIPNCTKEYPEVDDFMWVKESEWEDTAMRSIRKLLTHL